MNVRALPLVWSVVATLIVVWGAAALWGQRYSVGTYWDESDYLNLLHQLDRKIDNEGVVAAAKSVLWTDQARPPAYRLFVLPVLAAVEPDIRLLRIVSLCLLAVSTLVLFAAVRSVSTPGIAAVAAATFGASHAAVWAAARFGTDYVLYLAITGAFYALCRVTTRGTSPLTLVVLAASVALGSLSKTTFLAIFGPAAAAFVVAGWFCGSPRRDLLLVCVAGAVGLLTALPWWLYNQEHALAYAQVASTFIREDRPWLTESFFWLLGPPLFILAVVLVGFLVYRSSAWRGRVPGRLVPLLSAAAMGVVPFLLFHIFGPNHNMRLLSPALIPAAILCAVLLSIALQERQVAARRLGYAAAIACILQGAYIVHFLWTNDVDLWDWEPVRLLARERHIEHPLIVHMGAAQSLNPPSIAYPWVRRGESIRERWAWRYEEGAIDWSKIDALLADADIVIVPVSYSGRERGGEARDNAHNAEFRNRLEQSVRFEAPLRRTMGSEGVEIAIYVVRPPAAS